MLLFAPLAGFVLLAGATKASALEQTVTTERPAGQLVLRIDGDQVTVTDTRADDPGWSISGVASVEAVTPRFTDGTGQPYAQQVSIDNGVASAPAHRGLGIAHLTMTTDGDVITVTVI